MKDLQLKFNQTTVFMLRFLKIYFLSSLSYFSRLSFTIKIVNDNIIS